MRVTTYFLTLVALVFTTLLVSFLYILLWDVESLDIEFFVIAKTGLVRSFESGFYSQ